MRLPFFSQPPQILELTINNRMDFILDEIFSPFAGSVVVSTYIWNVDLVRRLAAEYRKLRPDALIGGGGPEVSYESEAFLRQNPAFDLIVRGEGEETVRHLLAARESGLDWTILPGLTVRSGQAVRTQPAPVCAGPGIPSLSYEADLSDTVEQIKYYESSRGCPFQCQYCLSSIEKGGVPLHWIRSSPILRFFCGPRPGRSSLWTAPLITTHSAPWPSGVFCTTMTTALPIFILKSPPNY